MELTPLTREFAIILACCIGFGMIVFFAAGIFISGVQTVYERIIERRKHK